MRRGRRRRARTSWRRGRLFTLGHRCGVAGGAVVFLFLLPLNPGDMATPAAVAVALCLGGEVLGGALEHGMRRRFCERHRRMIQAVGDAQPAIEAEPAAIKAEPPANSSWAICM